MALNTEDGRMSFSYVSKTKSKCHILYWVSFNLTKIVHNLHTYDIVVGKIRAGKHQRDQTRMRQKSDPHK